MNETLPLNQINPLKPVAPKAKRKSKTKWQWKDYKQEDAGWLGRQLLDWLHNNPDERRLINFLTDVAGMSYKRLKEMAADSAELQGAIDLACDIIAARHEDDWYNHQGKNINQYANRFFSLYSPLSQEKINLAKGLVNEDKVKTIFVTSSYFSAEPQVNGKPYVPASNRSY